MSIISKHYSSEEIKGFFCEEYEIGICNPCDKQCSLCETIEASKKRLNPEEKSEDEKK